MKEEEIKRRYRKKITNIHMKFEMTQNLCIAFSC